MGGVDITWMRLNPDGRCCLVSLILAVAVQMGVCWQQLHIAAILLGLLGRVDKMFSHLYLRLKVLRGGDS